MLINLDKIFGRTDKTKVVESARDTLNKWDAIERLLGSVGWQVLKEQIDKEYATHNSIDNLTENINIEHEQGYCRGLQYPNSIIDRLKRSAIEARKVLDSVVEEQRED